MSDTRITPGARLSLFSILHGRKRALLGAPVDSRSAYASRWYECDPDDFEQDRSARWLIPSVFPLKYPFNGPPFPTMIPRLRRLQTICFAAAAAATLGIPQVLAAAAGSFDPLRPEASGYRLEFNGTFDNASGICLKGSQGRPAAGFLWYARLFPVWGTWSQPKISVNFWTSASSPPRRTMSSENDACNVPRSKVRLIVTGTGLRCATMRDRDSVT